ncbi:hypothetical protein SAMN05216189_1001212 [Pseudomonas delhiensis]|uniref:Glycosyl transferase family 2 n=1 Tax=Pseudomonas delhiensis TaxID=366289 RepID=A0A239MRD6_9PSED|nr:glycosyltransferase family A protein [Pseudomonas delhiensis]SDH99886.1 hypothetical protein SAMN05216189_1001212 [Pseudomonas delhiensis]SNT44409.1 hypothetical protein SAMN06295949_12860 [Pseudomonas delhiensis]
MYFDGRTDMGEIKGHEMDAMPPVISLVGVFGSEGIRAQWSLWACQRMRRWTAFHGLSVQLVVVLDRPDCDTRRIVNEHPALQPTDRLLEVEHGDLSLARNAGIGLAEGECLGIFDGDSYCSANWLVEAQRVVRRCGGRVVVHPEYLLHHDQAFSYARCIDQLVDAYSSASCFKSYPWGAMVFARREVFEAVPYQPVFTEQTGFAFPDWHWGLEVIASGRAHTLASGTAAFCRGAPEGLPVQRKGTAGVPRPGVFFSRHLSEVG